MDKGQTGLRERARHTRVVSELAIEGNYSFHDDPISARISPPAEFFLGKINKEKYLVSTISDCKKVVFGKKWKTS